jgi:hypothetical protein
MDEQELATTTWYMQYTHTHVYTLNANTCLVHAYVNCITLTVRTRGAIKSSQPARSAMHV